MFWLELSQLKENTKILLQLKSGLKRAINFNKYHTKVSIAKQNQYLDYLIEFSSCKQTLFFCHLNIMHMEQNTVYFFPTVKIKDYNVTLISNKFLSMIL